MPPAGSRCSVSVIIKSNLGHLQCPSSMRQPLKQELLSCSTTLLEAQDQASAQAAARVAFNQDSQVLRKISSTMALSHPTNNMRIRTSQ